MQINHCDASSFLQAWRLQSGAHSVYRRLEEMSAAKRSSATVIGRILHWPWPTGGSKVRQFNNRLNHCIHVCMVVCVRVPKCVPGYWRIHKIMSISIIHWMWQMGHTYVIRPLMKTWDILWLLKYARVRYTQTDHNTVMAGLLLANV